MRHRRAPVTGNVRSRMRARTVGLYLFATLLLSGVFALTAVYTFAWASHPPASATTYLIRAFYMPQAMSAAVALDVLGLGYEPSVLGYVLAFAATLPSSF